MANGSAEPSGGGERDRRVGRGGVPSRDRTPFRNLDERLNALHAHTERLRHELAASPTRENVSATQITLGDLESTVEELRVAEEELRVQNEELLLSRRDLENALHRYQELFEHAPDPYIVTDALGMIREANSAAARLLGFPAGRLIRTQLANYIVGAERRGFRATVGRIAAGDTSQTGDAEWMLKVKPRRSDAVDVACTVAAVHDREGNLVSLRWLVRDITARQRAEGEVRALNSQLEQRVQERTVALEAANWAKAEFLSVMAHELRTPLNAILGYTELLEMGLPGPVTEGQISHLSRIRSGGMRLIGLINEVLDLGKLEAGELRVAQEDLPVVAAVNSALTLVMPQAAAHGVRIDNHCFSDPDLSYRGDQTRLEQILINLFSNAIKFTEPGGVVTITCSVEVPPETNIRLMESAGPWLALRVADTGIGMAPQVLSRVFEPFVQVESPLTRTKGGTGLGLTIGRRLARLMSGDLTVESREGVGSTFTVWLPAALSSKDQMDPAVERREPERYAKGIAHLGELMMEELDAIVRKYAKQLNGKGGIAAAASLSSSELEDHAAAFLADIIQSLVIVEEAGDGASGIMRDGGVLRRLISERHGAQRKRVGWSEEDLKREFELIRAAVFAALRRVARHNKDAAVQDQRRAAQNLLAKLLESAEQTSLRGYRLAAMDDSRKATHAS